MTYNKLQNFVLDSSKFGIAYNLSLIMTIVALHYFAVQFLLDDDFGYFGERMKFEKIIDTIQVGFTILTSIYILSAYCIHQEIFIDLVNEVKSLEGSTSNSKNNSLSSGIGKIFLVHAILWSLLIFTSVIEKWDIVIYNISMYLCNMVISSIFIQYCVTLKLIHTIFNNINKSLHGIFKRDSSWCEISILSKNDDLASLRSLHSSTSKLSQKISDFYSHLILVSISCILITFVLFGYYALSSIVKGKNLLPVLDLVHCICYLILYAALLLILTKNVTSTIKEVRLKLVNRIFV